MGWIEERMPHWRLIAIVGLLGLGVIVPLVIMVADLVSCGQPPSEAVIRRGIATALIDRRINPSPGLITPLPQCDRACSDQLAIEISAIDGCHHATKPYLPASEPVEEYWDITVDVLEQPGPGRSTVRFWRDPDGWEVDWPAHAMIVVDEFDAQRVSIPFQ
jgi:hypothetical protein